MGRIRIDAAKCNHCGLCAADCPLRIVRLEAEGPAIPPADEALCIGCGHCVAVCPEGALDHRFAASEACPAMEERLALSAEQVEHFLRSRRSIRQFGERTVDRPLLERLIRVACAAPSGHNSQPWKWLVISGRSEVATLAELVMGWMRALQVEQPEVFQALHLERILRAAEAGEDRVLRGAPHLIVVHAEKENRFAPVASANALAYLELAAPSLGLGTCWAGYFTRAAGAYAPLQEALRLPAGHAVFGAAMVGYPSVRYARIPLRREPRISWR